MHILKRILLLCFMGAGVQALSTHAADAPAGAAGQPGSPKPADNSPAVNSAQPAAPTLDAQSEQKARDLLHQLTAPAPAPQVGANPPDLNGRDAAREKALSEVRRMTNSTASTLNRAQLDAEREKEISRIENEVEASRKRQVRTWTSAKGTNALFGSVLASPAEPTLTTAAEKKARELLNTDNVIVIEAENPAQSHPAKRPESSTFSVFGQKPATPTTTAAPRPTPSAAPVVAQTPAPAAASSDSGTLNGSDEEKAREILRKTLEQPATATSGARSGVLPPAAPSSLDLPPAPAGNAPKPEVTEAPKAPPVPEVTPTLPVPSPTPTPAVTAADDAALTAEKEAAARKLLERSYTSTPAAAPKAPAAPVAPAPAPADGQSFTVKTPTPPPVAPIAPVAPAPAPVVSAPVVAPAAAGVAMTPEDEAKARALLSQQGADLSNKTFAPSAPASAVVPTAPAAGLPQPPSTTVTTSTLTAEQEAAARDLVSQEIARKAAAPSAALPTPAPAPTPEPAPVPAPPQVVVSPPVQATVAPVVTPAPAVVETQGTLTADQEAKARAALEQAEKQLASIPPATQNVPHVDSASELKAKTELIKQQEKEGKKRRAAEKKQEEAANKKRLEQEAKTKKEMDRLNKEEQAKAKAEARRQLEAEAAAHKQAKASPTVAAETVRPAEGTTTTVNLAPAPAPAPAPAVTKAAPPVETRSATSAVPAGAKTKAQRLDDLTQLYVHDKISAQDYYKERTKILSEPGE